MNAPAAGASTLVSPAGLARLALPLAASLGLGFFLHYVNRTVLSWHSSEALAAALPAGMLAWTFQGFFLLTCGYLGVFASQHHGAREDREAGAMAWPMFIVAGLATVLSLALIPFRHQLAGLFGTEPAVEAKLAELLGWYLAEAGAMALAGGLSGFCGGIGRTRLVFAVAAAGAALCIALNYWLVLGGLGLPALGVTGAGLAGLITAAAGSLFWLAWFFAPAQRARFHSWAARNADPARLRRFLVFAAPRGATEILEMVAFVAFTMVVTRLGSTALSAANLAFNTYLLVLVPVIGFSQGTGIAVGRCLGEGRPDLARQAVRSAFRLLLPYLALLVAAFLLIPEWLLAPARGRDDAAWAAQLELAVPAMWCLALSIVGDGTQWIWRGAIQGAGDTRWPLLVLLALAVVLLALPAWLVQPHLHGKSGLVVCYLILGVYVSVIAAVMAWRYRGGAWAAMSVRG